MLEDVFHLCMDVATQLQLYLTRHIYVVVTEYFIVGVCQVTFLYAQNLSVHICKL